MAQSTTSPVNEPIKCLEFIYENIEAGQTRTGVLSLDGCRFTKTAFEELVKFFNNPTATYNKENVAKCFNMLRTGVEKQNEKGIYTLSRAAELADYRDRLAGFIIERTGPYEQPATPAAEQK